MESTCPLPPTTPEDIPCLSARQLLYLYRNEQLTPTDVIDAYINRIEETNPAINAYTHTLFDAAREAAEESDQRWQRHRPRPLEGIPLAVSDLTDLLADVRSTFGSQLFDVEFNYTPSHNAYNIDLLINAGAIPLGKTNVSEFGHRNTTDNLPHGPTSTPTNLAYNAGGGAGGSAAALASGMTALAQGTDISGSLRVPAAMTGTVAMTMTPGRIPQNLPIAAHSPFSAPGPAARTIGDLALLADVMTRPWSMDPYSQESTHSYQDALNEKIRGVHIAYSPNLDLWPVDEDVASVVSQAAASLCSAGAIVIQPDTIGFSDLTHPAFGDPLTHIDVENIWLAQISVLYAHLNDILMLTSDEIDMREHPDDVSEEFMELINQGYDQTALEYRLAELIRFNGINGSNGLNYALETLLEEYDYLIAPTILVDGVENAGDNNTLGPSDVDGTSVDPLVGWTLTYITNLTGHPSISVPAGTSATGLPVGLQIIGSRFDDYGLIAVAAELERQRPWLHRLPCTEEIT